MDPTLAPPSPGRDSAGIRIVESAEPAWLGPWTIGTDAFLRVGDVPGRAEHELHQVKGALRSADGGLLIANGGTNELRRYSATGEYVSAAGGTGQGPGEFVELTLAFRQEDDSIAVYDSRERRLSLFAPDGGFVRTVPFDSVPSSVQLPLTRWPDGSYLFANRDVLLLADLRAQGATRIERKGREVTRYWPEGGRQQVASLPGMELVVGPRGGPLPFGRNTAVAAAAGRWIAADNARYELQFRAPDGAVTLLARRLVEPRPLTPREMEAAAALFGGSPLRPELPTTAPAFGTEMLIDSEGNVWVKEFTTPDESVNDWSVFNPEGVWLGTLAAPAALRLLAIGSDYVIGVSRDALDVEVVSVHRLEKP